MARKAVEKEEQELRDHPGDIFTPPNIFENGVGHFWGIHETRGYMRARYHLVDAILQVFGAPGGRIDAVKEALEHLLDMLRLCRGDNMGIRDLVPHLFIRLNKDQAAYDFVKWYATTGSESNYDWGDMDLPYLDVKDADVLEEPLEAWSNGQYLSLSHVAAVTLIKVRILLDLQAAQNTTRALNGTIPREIIGLIQTQLVGSAVESRPDILMRSTEDLSKLISKIKDQIVSLYKSVNTYNPHFWKLMLSDAFIAAGQRPGMYSHETKEEACLMIGYCLASWIETPGSFEVMRDVSKIV
ncbi:MYND finger [Fusarium austroafricanum]|uniref:MYND finger n=1 Tax=Fusarium austroafricanum TaxID=2364996 RepID=A0A8H4K267_9HYPO|nr:MYND finger [Fusarium austroafricanum]